MNDVPPDVLTFDDYGEDEEKNEDNSGYNTTKSGRVRNETMFYQYWIGGENILQYFISTR